MPSIHSGYTALQQNEAFVPPPASTVRTGGNVNTTAGPGAVTFIPVPQSPVESFEIEECSGSKRRCLSRAKVVWRGAVATFRSNTGILLVAASQFFFALMNVAVKKLNSLDEPVSTLEVRHAVDLVIPYHTGVALTCAPSSCSSGW